MAPGGHSRASQTREGAQGRHHLDEEMFLAAGLSRQPP